MTGNIKTLTLVEMMTKAAAWETDSLTQMYRDTNSTMSLEYELVVMIDSVDSRLQEDGEARRGKEHLRVLDRSAV